MNLHAAYKTLGLNVGAQKDVAQPVYRRLVRYWHPDRNDSPEAHRKTQQINAAWTFLETSNFPKAEEAWNVDEGLDSSLPVKKPCRGNSIRRVVKLSIEEAAFGTTINLNGKVSDKCPSCAGHKVKDIDCPVCEGTGKVEDSSKGAKNLWRGTTRCYHCNGLGRVVETCELCEGTGTNPQIRDYELTVKIPKGIVQGTTLLIKGRGGKTTDHSRNGDVIITIEIKAHPIFHFDEEGYLSCRVPIDFLDFMCGIEIKVPTLFGMKTVKMNPPHAMIEVEKSGFPGRNGEVFPLRVYLDVIKKPVTGQYLEILRKAVEAMKSQGMPVLDEFSDWERAVQLWEQSR